jgi:hypothetical protein
MSAVVLLPSCSDDPVSPGGGTSGPSWVAWRNPNVFSYTCWLNAIWGSSPRDIYAVGEYGMVLHSDGQKWEVLRYGQEDGLSDVWGSSSTDVFVVGRDGIILHYDGTRWSRMPSGTTAALNAVWGRASNDVYAVGESGAVLHYDGNEWRTVSTGTDRTLNGVWGVGDWIFAVGDKGTVLRLTPWEARAVDVSTANDLYGIGGNFTSGLCAVGQMGTILQWNGSEWHGARSRTTADLKNVRGTREGHLIAVSASRVLEFDGREWGFVEVTGGGWGDEEFVDVWGISTSSLFLLQRRQVLHGDGSTWTAMDMSELSGDAPGETLLDAWGTSGISVYAAGERGNVFHFDGVDWTSTKISWGALSAVWGVSETEVYAVGNWQVDSILEECEDPPCNYRACEVLSFDGATWSRMGRFTHGWIKGIWGSSGDNLFAVGSVEVYRSRNYYEGYRLILRWDGAAWNTMVDGTTSGRFNDVWGSSQNDVFAVGDAGLIFRFDGSAWTEMASGATTPLYATWGSSGTDVFAVGENGTILHFDGESWSPMASGTANSIMNVWGSAMDNVFAVGDAGVILGYDGERWRQMKSPTVNPLRGVWGSAPDDVFAVGVYGTICHYGQH